MKGTSIRGTRAAIAVGAALAALALTGCGQSVDSGQGAAVVAAVQDGGKATGAVPVNVTLSPTPAAGGQEQAPSKAPTKAVPTKAPTKAAPTKAAPTKAPTKAEPTKAPTSAVPTSAVPTSAVPTKAPTATTATSAPTPTRSPSSAPTPTTAPVPGGDTEAGPPRHRATPSSIGVPLDLKAATPKCGGKNSERSFVDSQFQWDIGEGWFYDLCTDKASDTLTLALIQPDGKPGTTTTVNLPAGPGAGITCGLTSETPPTCVVQVPDPETGGHWVGSLFQLADTGWIDLNPHRYSSIVPMALYSVGVSDSAAGQLILAEGTRSPELANGGNVPEYYWVTEIFDGYADTAGCTVATRHGLPRLPQDTNLGSCDQGALTVLEDK